MYKSFKLSVLTPRIFQDANTKIGTRLNESNKMVVRDSLEPFIGIDGVVDGSKLQEHWFPKIKADVFISHSHQDEKTALALAGWLQRNFKLKPFIDSCVWGFADQLLREIDKGCLNKNRKTYNYQKRNGTTSHVHMMLSTALGKMIDSTECLIFLNTPQSITTKNAVDTTQSPWLFAELSMASIIRRTAPIRPRIISEKFTTEQDQKEITSAHKFQYRVDLTPMECINCTTLKRWREMCSASEARHPLDVLYDMPHKQRRRC